MSEEEMDSFVFAVMPKKTANKMQKELQDLVSELIEPRFTVMCNEVP